MTHSTPQLKEVNSLEFLDTYKYTKSYSAMTQKDQVHVGQQSNFFKYNNISHILNFIYNPTKKNKNFKLRWLLNAINRQTMTNDVKFNIFFLRIGNKYMHNF